MGSETPGPEGGEFRPEPPVEEFVDSAEEVSPEELQEAARSLVLTERALELFDKTSSDPELIKLARYHLGDTQRYVLDTTMRLVQSGELTQEEALAIVEEERQETPQDSDREEEYIGAERATTESRLAAIESGEDPIASAEYKQWKIDDLKVRIAYLKLLHEKYRPKQKAAKEFDVSDLNMVIFDKHLAGEKVETIGAQDPEAIGQFDRTQEAVEKVRQGLLKAGFSSEEVDMLEERAWQNAPERAELRAEWEDLRRRINEAIEARGRAKDVEAADEAVKPLLQRAQEIATSDPVFDPQRRSNLGRKLRQAETSEEEK